MGVRKQETDRIERENHAFAKRLFDRQANLSKKKLDDDYHDHIKYLKQIQKLKAATGSAHTTAVTAAEESPIVSNATEQQPAALDWSQTYGEKNETKEPVKVTEVVEVPEQAVKIEATEEQL